MSGQGSLAPACQIPDHETLCVEAEGLPVCAEPPDVTLDDKTQDLSCCSLSSNKWPEVGEVGSVGGAASTRTFASASGKPGLRPPGCLLPVLVSDELQESRWASPTESGLGLTA